MKSTFVLSLFAISFSGLFIFSSCSNPQANDKIDSDSTIVITEKNKSIEELIPKKIYS
jgi:hypothetical protein